MQWTKFRGSQKRYQMGIVPHLGQACLPSLGGTNLHGQQIKADRQKSTDLTDASDGYAARKLPDWTREKLRVIDHYMGISCTAMKGKFTLVYADLLAGPGLCADPVTKEEQAGSALLAVQRPEFKRLFLNDVDPNATMALKVRTSLERLDRIHISTGDCNRVVDECRSFLFPSGYTERTLALVVLDPTGFQMHYDTIARLTHGVKRMDLIITLMTGFQKRFISTASFRSAMDRVYGTSEWQRLIARGDQVEVGKMVTSRELLDLYKEQLVKLDYISVVDGVRMVNSTHSTIYHLLYASKHRLGADFFSKICQTDGAGQRRLFW